MSPTSIFAPAATPARWVFDLSLMIYSICGAIFFVVGGLLVYAVIKFRKRGQNESCEPAQVYGSNQIELAWTIVPILIVLVLFLASARVIAATQKAPPSGSLEVDVIGHQFWWELRYPSLGVVTANELHIPVTDPGSPDPTVLNLDSADTVHSFWVPQLAGKTDLIPNFPNVMWLDPARPGLYEGQCAQYCGAQHAKMLLRVYVQSKADFANWVGEQQRPVRDETSRGRELFEQTACVNCHAVAGTAAVGRFGPDLTHLMSRATLGAGIVPNTRENLRAWVKDPSAFKPASLMPAMSLDDDDLDALVDYLMTLR